MIKLKTTAEKIKFIEIFWETLSDLIIYKNKMEKFVSFPSLVIMVLFIQLGMVSFNAFLDVDSPLVESAVNVDDVTMDGTF